MKLCPLGLDVFEKVRSRVPVRTAHMPLLMENELYALTSSTRLHAERGSIQAGHRQLAHTLSAHAYDDSNGALVDHFDFEDFSLVVHN